MVDQARARRLAKRITQIVAAALEHEVKDPRLAMVTITDTRVTGDLREATVYYTVLGETVDAEPDSAGAAAALASATGVLRSLVGRGHRDPAHPVADVRARRGAGRGPPDGGAAGPHPRVRRRGRAARRGRRARGRRRSLPRAARAGRAGVTRHEPGGREARRVFLATALRRPGTVGAVVPSSPRLAAVLAVGGAPAGAPVVVELGPGTGAVSAVISRRLPAAARHLAVELDPRMVAYLRRTHPELEVVPGDAAHLAALLAERGRDRADAVIGGLPWALFDEPTQARDPRRGQPGDRDHRARSPRSPTCTG